MDPVSIVTIVGTATTAALTVAASSAGWVLNSKINANNRLEAMRLAYLVYGNN